MARRISELCIICERMPCACNKPRAKKSGAVLPRNEPLRNPILPVVESPRPPRAGLALFKPLAPMVKHAPLLNTDPGQLDKDLGRAIAVLIRGGLIPSREDIERHRHLIDMTDEEINGIRANEWTSRRERRAGN